MNSQIMITIKESFELLIGTLSRLDERKLRLNDNDLAYHIFEELDSEYHSFLHEWTVNRLIENGLINSTLRDRILSLRDEIKSTIGVKNNVTLYREDEDWIRIRNEADSIIKQIKYRH